MVKNFSEQTNQNYIRYPNILSKNHGEVREKNAKD